MSSYSSDIIILALAFLSDVAGATLYSFYCFFVCILYKKKFVFSYLIKLRNINCFAYTLNKLWIWIPTHKICCSSKIGRQWLKCIKRFFFFALGSGIQSSKKSVFFFGRSQEIYKYNVSMIYLFSVIEKLTT